VKASTFEEFALSVFRPGVSGAVFRAARLILVVLIASLAFFALSDLQSQYLHHFLLLIVFSVGLLASLSWYMAVKAEMDREERQRMQQSKQQQQKQQQQQQQRATETTEETSEVSGEGAASPSNASSGSSSSSSKKKKTKRAD
jgi:cytoskeletal protein RodZ